LKIEKNITKNKKKSAGNKRNKSVLDTAIIFGLLGLSTSSSIINKLSSIIVKIITYILLIVLALITCILFVRESQNTILVWLVIYIKNSPFSVRLQNKKVVDVNKQMSSLKHSI